MWFSIVMLVYQRVHLLNKEHHESIWIMSYLISILGENRWERKIWWSSQVDAHFRDDNHWASILTTDSDASVIGGPSNQTQLGGSPMKGKSICGYKRDFHGFLFAMLAMLAMLDFGTWRVFSILCSTHCKNILRKSRLTKVISNEESWEILKN